ncbi:MAG: MarR family transcriptional regulator [Pseudomonadota bacterium]
MNASRSVGLGSQLRRLLELLDGDLEEIYREEHEFYVPRFTPVIKALAVGKPLTIKEISNLSYVSHSAASQTITQLTRHGLVELETGADRRSRLVSLTQKGRELLPWLELRWAATQAAADDLNAELDHPLSELLDQAIARLEATPFSKRIRHFEQVRDPTL